MISSICAGLTSIMASAYLDRYSLVTIVFGVAKEHGER